MKSIPDKILLRVFLLIWTCINLLQAYFTELAHDEAYYWTWSKHMDWGFLEHPPMVALFIKIGYLFIPNELGLRFITVFSSTFVIWLVYRYLIQKDLKLYLAIVSSIFLFHVGGFLTAPDSPLYLFVAVYYVLLKSYLSKDSWKTALLLTLILTAMMYSKYHGVLVIFFTIVFNLNLLKRKSFWLMAILSTILFVPHLYWLFTKGGSGMEYALSGRFSDSFNYLRVFDFIGGQLLVLGPILGIVFFYSVFKYKATNNYERTLKWITVSVLVYFMLWSLKGRTEANWTASVFIPIVLLAHYYITQKLKLRKWVMILSLPSILIMLCFRLFLMVEIPAFPNLPRQAEFHGWKDYALRVDSLANGLPVITTNYQNASKTWFYTGSTTLPLNTNDRPNQFNLWNYEESILDVDVLIISPYLHDMGLSVIGPNGRSLYARYPKFRSYKDLQMEVSIDNQESIGGEIMKIPIHITAPKNRAVHSEKNGGPLISLGVTIKKGEEIVCWNCQRIDTGNIDETKEILYSLILPEEEGTYELNFHITARELIIWRSEGPYYIEIANPE